MEKQQPGVVTSEKNFDKRPRLDLEAAHSDARPRHRTSLIAYDMTSGMSKDNITRVKAARSKKRKCTPEEAPDEAVLVAEFDKRVSDLVDKRVREERVSGLEAREREAEASVREMKARLKDAERHLDAIRAELEAARLTPEEAKAMRCGLWSLPPAVISEHILSSDFLPDPTDVAWFRAVSTTMRDAVAASGRELKKPEEEEAVEKGYLSTLKHMHSRGRLCSEESLCMVAAKNGQLAEIKKFRAKNFLWDESTCWCAAEGGHLDVLQWARANDCPWDEGTCAYAAYSGHLDVLQWARANDCPWDKETCANAAKRGHLEVLKWAREKGCPWTKKTRRLAARKGYVES